MEEFVERRKTGQGIFLTDSTLRMNDDRRLPDLLRELGFQIEDMGFKQFALSTGRCRMKIVLDGAVVFEGPGVRTNDVDLGFYRVADLGAIEIYTRAAQAPIQYTRTGSTCGVIILWSREM